jgi:hypothetical protein
MGNIRELLINVVILNKPKVLIGLNQKGKGYGWGVTHFLYALYKSPGEKAGPNPSC